jgi:hypothetical protein
MKTIAAATALLAVAMSFAAVLPAEAGPRHEGKRGRGHHSRMQQQFTTDSPAAAVTQTGSAVNIVQNGDQNGVIAVANTGTTNIAQNGNNNNLTVIQVTVVGRGKGRRRGYGHQ